MVPGELDVDAVLAGVVHRPGWHREAACGGMGTPTFFPGLGQSTEPAVGVQ